MLVLQYVSLFFSFYPYDLIEYPFTYCTVNDKLLRSLIDMYIFFITLIHSEMYLKKGICGGIVSIPPICLCIFNYLVKFAIICLYI